MLLPQLLLAAAEVVVSRYSPRSNVCGSSIAAYAVLCYES